METRTNTNTTASKIAKANIAKCREKYLEAVATLKYFEISEPKLLQEFESFKSAFNMYAEGVPFRKIKEDTGEDIQSRIINGSLPKLISKYGGISLTDTEILERQAKIDVITKKATLRFNKAKAILKKRKDPDIHDKLRKDIEKIKLLDIALKLYLKGLSISTISILTKCPVQNWVSDLAIPIQRGKITKREYLIPKQITPEVAYIAGAYLACHRVLNANERMTFNAKTEQGLDRIRNSMKKAFQIDMPQGGRDSNFFSVSLTRDGFVRDFLKLIKIDPDLEVKIPEEVLKYDYLRKPFLDGFFTFAGGTIVTGKHSKFSITRTKNVKQDLLLKGILIALSFENIYFNLNFNNMGITLTSGDAVELRKFFSLFTDLGEEEVRNKLLSELSTKVRPEFANYQNYQKFMTVILKHFEDTKRLDFVKLCQVMGIDIEELTNEQKTVISIWKKGTKPEFVKRAELINQYIRDIYPELI